MKKTLSVSIFILIIWGLLSCNQKAEKNTTSTETDSSKIATQKEETDTPKFTDADFEAFEQCASNGSGIGNIVINDFLSKSMTDHFDLLYGTQNNRDHINSFRRGYWMDKCLVASIDRFLKDNAHIYDGIRLRFGCDLVDDNSNYPNDRFKRKTSLFIYATKPNGIDNTTHEKKHKDDETVIIPTNTSCSTASEYIQPHSIVSKRTLAFDEIYRHRNVPPNQPADFDALSQGVWIAPCVITYLNNLLQTSNNNLDGIKIKTAAYLETHPDRPSQKYPNQSTILIVPTSPMGQDHRERPDVINAFINMLELKKAKFDASGTLNHGQLCPNQCN